MNKFLIILMLTTVSACRPLTTESPLILDMKKNMEANAENTIKLSKNVDKIADKIGLDIPSITPELKDALKQLQADNDKKYDLLDAKFNKIIELMLKTGASAVGVPAPVVNAGIGMTEALLGGGGLMTVTKYASDFLANRRRQKEKEEFDEHCRELEEKHKQEKEEIERKIREEEERERQGLKARLEREKEELRVKGLIKAETMAYIKEESQQEFISARERAIKSLKARGEI